MDDLFPDISDDELMKIKERQKPKKSIKSVNSTRILNVQDQDQYSMRVINIDDNNGWNYQLEADVKHIGESSGGLRWMHNQCSGIFIKRYWITVGITIVAAAVVTTFNSITGAECIASSEWNIFKIISIIGSATVGVVTVFGGVKNYGSRATAHQVAEGNYQALFYTIKRQLHLSRSQRQNGKDFLEWIQKEYTDLTSNISSPDIPDFIFKRYEKQVNGTDIAKYNDIEEINIKEESPKRKNTKMSVFITDEDRVPSRIYTANGRDAKFRRKKSRLIGIPPNHQGEIDDSSGSDDANDKKKKDYVVTIPSEMSSKDKWQLERFYRNQ